ncbi:MAG: carbohydrate kinase family protein [Candidatus Spechtbacterales bacterium]
MSKFDVITIGSATRDVFLESGALTTLKSEHFSTGEGVCIPAGSKVEIDNIYLTTGGSAVNAAVTFANQGFNAALVSKTGNDSEGNTIKEQLKKAGVETKHIIGSDEYKTAYSVIVHSTSGERSIFVYRGASAHFPKSEFNFNLLQSTKWIYVTHMGGDSSEIFEELVTTAHEKGVKIALNPGSTQLESGESLIPLLDKVDILFVNQEEAAHLTGEDYKDEHKVFEKLDSWVKGIAVMTKGSGGVAVSDGKTKWEAPALKEPVFKDRTGAGDAFGSGFTSVIMRGQSILEAIQAGSTNATGVVGEWGANNGILKKNDSTDKFGKLEIKEIKI